MSVARTLSVKILIVLLRDPASDRSGYISDMDKGADTLQELNHSVSILPLPLTSVAGLSKTGVPQCGVKRQTRVEATVNACRQRVPGSSNTRRIVTL